MTQASLISNLPPWLADWFQHPILGPLLGLLLLVTVVVGLHLVLQRYILRGIDSLLRRTTTWWDDVLAEKHVFRRLAWLLPLVVIQLCISLVPMLNEEVIELVQRLVRSLIVFTVLMSLSAGISAFGAIYSRYEIARGRPIKGYLQAIQMVIWLIGFIVIMATLANQSPWYFISGLGAMTAILLLIFRDTLLSLVAGIQITTTDVVRMGDWIEMPQFGADGDVVDITLHQVKVQNWDKTITIIPTHKFLENSFKNWRRMFEAGGRRIKRAINIDMSTIRFLTEEEQASFSRFRVLSEYMQRKQAELQAWNAEHGADGVRANRRQLTNVGTFRAYLIGYLRAHPLISQEMTFLVRQLPPGPEGLPLEIYVFSTDTRWAVYEDIQADVFDHVLSILPEFGLRVFQRPSGADFSGLRTDDHFAASAELAQPDTQAR